MAFWLLKTEPETWSWAMQVARGDRGECWSGVRNYQARNHLRNMQKGELAFFYHSGKTKEVVGLVQVLRPAYADPTDPSGKFLAIDVKAKDSLRLPVSLSSIKSEPRLGNMVLVANTRLSVQPVSVEEWKRVCAMGGIRYTAE